MKLYTLKEAAEILRMPYRSIYEKVRHYEIKASKAGRRWLISEDAIREYLEEHANIREKHDVEKQKK